MVEISTNKSSDPLTRITGQLFIGYSNSFYNWCCKEHNPPVKKQPEGKTGWQDTEPCERWEESNENWAEGFFPFNRHKEENKRYKKGHALNLQISWKLIRNSKYTHYTTANILENVKLNFCSHGFVRLTKGILHFKSKANSSQIGDTRVAVTWWWWNRRRADTWWWWWW